MSDPFPDDVDEQSWDEACRRADAIRNFLKRRTGSTKTGDVVELAAEKQGVFEPGHRQPISRGLS